MLKKYSRLKTTLLFLFSFLAFYFAQSQTISEYELTQHEPLFAGKQNAKQLFEKYYQFIKDAHALNNVNPDSAQLIYFNCDTFLTQQNLKSLRHRVLLDYGFQHSRTGDADEAMRILNLLEKDGIDKTNYFFAFCFYRIKSQAFKAQSKLKEAIENAMIAKQKLTDGNQSEQDKKKSAYNTFFIINIQSDISNLFKDTKQIEKSLQLQQDNISKINNISNDVLALADKKEKDKDLYLANSYNNISLTLITKLQDDQPPQPDTNIVNYLNKAIVLSKKIGNNVFLGAAYYNLSNYYGIIEDYPNKKIALEKSLEVNTLLNDEIGLIFCKSELASTIIKLKQSPERAMQLAQEALDAARLQQDLGSKGTVYLTYCEALNYNGRVGEAQIYFDSASTFKTNELKTVFDKEITEMQTKYETVEKEKQILKQDSEIKQRKAQMKMLYGGIGAFAVIALMAYRSFLNKKKANIIITKEKQRSDELLLNILPAETAEELKATGSAKAKSFDLVTVLFTDFKNFTQASEKLSPEELVKEINFCYSAFDKIITNHGIEKIKTIGDAYMCAGGLPVSNTTHATDVVAAGLEMIAFIEKNKQERIRQNQPFFELRLGIHTGPVVAGIVGIKKFAYDIWGDTVNTASRMESSGEVGKVNVSGATYELVKDRFNCTHRGKIQAKNKGEIDMYFVNG